MDEPESLTPALSDGRSREEQSFLRWLAEMAVLAAAAFVLATGIKTFVVQPFRIPSASMVPTLAVGDRVLVNKYLYRFRSPRRGDIVVFTSPEVAETDLIKRVIAVGGRTVAVRDGAVYVDGAALSEPYVSAQVPDTYTSERPAQVPNGYVWLMGDNRPNSHDSRYFGPQPVRHLLGKAFFIYWPPARMRVL